MINTTSLEDYLKDPNRSEIPWYLVIDAEVCGLCGSSKPGSDHFAPVASNEAIPGGVVTKLYRVPLCGPCAATLKGNPEERIRRTPDLARFVKEYISKKHRRRGGRR